MASWTAGENSGAGGAWLSLPRFALGYERTPLRG